MVTRGRRSSYCSQGCGTMGRVGLVLLAAGAICFPAAQAQAVTLTTPTGKPVGGKWQRWAEEARVPTVTRLVLDVSDTDAEGSCGDGVSACSIGWAKGQPQETIVASSASRDSFYYELGHQFDWQRLTASERVYLVREWGASGARWTDSQAALNHGAEDGLEGVFPQVYADCAAGVNDQGEDLVVGFFDTPLRYAPPGITSRINTCAWLAKTAHSAKHWYWRSWEQVPAPETTIG